MCHTPEVTLDVLRPVFEDLIINRRTQNDSLFGAHFGPEERPLQLMAIVIGPF